MKLSRFSQGKFTFSDWVVLIIIIGIFALAAGSIYIGEKNRARDRNHVSAARADLEQFRQALYMYQLDYADYPDPDMPISNCRYIPDLTKILKDPQGEPYISLPIGDNFDFFYYEYCPGGDNGGLGFTPAGYEIIALCLNYEVVLRATPDSLYQFNY